MKKHVYGYEVMAVRPMGRHGFETQEGVYIPKPSWDKTPTAVVDWAYREKLARPEWVEWEKPSTIAADSEWNDPQGRGEGEKWYLKNEDTRPFYEKPRWVDPAEAYARTVAIVQLHGEERPRRLRVTFTRDYNLTGEGQINLPKTNGCSWVVEEIE